jgi:hypothetical protein
MVNISPYGIGFNSGDNHSAQEGDGLVNNAGGTISGFTGVDGITGLIGITGAIGIQGTSGIALFGATGIEGSQGITGIDGVTGFRGTTGLVGSTGLLNIGETGIQGATGILGLTGVLGSLGVMGLQGGTGLAALNATGIQGRTGIAGITGVAGLVGETGISGLTGLLGTTGLQGITGFGLLGITGLIGTTGIAGLTGIAHLTVLNLQRQLIGSTLLYVVPASTLTKAQYLEFFSTVQAASDGSPTTFNVVFGGTNIFSDTLNSSNTTGLVQGIVLRLGLTTQECVVAAVYSNGDSQTQRTLTSLTLSSPQDFVTNSTNQNGGAVVLNQLIRRVGDPNT